MPASLNPDPLAHFEDLSRAHPGRVLRLFGSLSGQDGAAEPLELLIYRGMSSCTSHPLPWDPDRSALPVGAVLQGGELFAAPFGPGAQSLSGPLDLERCRDPEVWRRDQTAVS